MTVCTVVFSLGSQSSSLHNQFGCGFCLFVCLLFQSNINANKNLAVAQNSQSSYTIKSEISLRL